MKKKLAILIGAISLFNVNTFASEQGYITKAEIEAVGKEPYSINYKYQQDYLNGNPIPESAVYYEKMVTKSELEEAGKEPDSVDEKYRTDYFANNLIPLSAVHYKNAETTKAQQNYILNWNGEYKNNDRIIKVSQNGTKVTVTVINKAKTRTTYNTFDALTEQLRIGSQYDKNSWEYKKATQNNIFNNLYGNAKTVTTPEKTLFTSTGTLDTANNVVWLYPGKNYQVKLSFTVSNQIDLGDFIAVYKNLSITDNTSKLGKNPFEPNGLSISGYYDATTNKYK